MEAEARFPSLKTEKVVLVVVVVVVVVAVVVLDHGPGSKWVCKVVQPV